MTLTKKDKELIADALNTYIGKLLYRLDEITGDPGHYSSTDRRRMRATASSLVTLRRKLEG